MHIFTDYIWDKGIRTGKNQDSLAICQMVVGRKRCFMAVVCDGIGSFDGSERASGYVTERLITWFYQKGPEVLGKGRSFRSVINAVNRELYRINRAFADDLQQNTGCTLSMLIIIEHRYFVWNVGDSRVYKKKRGHMRSITVDDVSGGRLIRCIGSFSWKGVYTMWGHACRDEVFLVCSDGFYRRLTDVEFKAIVSDSIDTEAAAGRLLKEAGARFRAKGESDDMSAIYVRLKKTKYKEG